MNLINSINPILDRELRQRSRSYRMPVILSIFLLILLGIFMAVRESTIQNAQWMGEEQILQADSLAGRTTFEVTAMVVLGLMMFIIPASASTAISAERDRQTLIPLQVTLMGPYSIYFGKVISALAFVGLLVFASMPVMAISYVLGGISLLDVVFTMAFLCLMGLVTAIIGVTASCLFRRPAISVLATYLAIGALAIGSLILIGVLSVFSGDAVLWPLYVNPFVGLAGVAGTLDGAGFGGSEGPLTGIHQGMMNAQPWDDQAVGPSGLPLWLRSAIPLVVGASVLSMIGVRSLTTPRAKLN